MAQSTQVHASLGAARSRAAAGGLSAQARKDASRQYQEGRNAGLVSTALVRLLALIVPLLLVCWRAFDHLLDWL